MPAARAPANLDSRNALARIPSGHTCATHLMESGTDLATIQLLMGHEKLQDTTVYLHLSRRHLNAAVNPLERITVRSFNQKRAEPKENGRS